MFPQSNSDSYQKVKNVFIHALEIAPEKRRAFLAGYETDKNLLAEVESLLQAREEAGEFLNNVSAADTVHRLINGNDKFIGQKIGNYRIEREIGRGGMGIVFLANHEDFRQQAAIKLIKRGMDSEAIQMRFQREREILAALNHPFIARLTDGGTTENDVPFFVMEYVEGVTIDEFCRNNKLSEKAILELFRKICEAVAFAHQKLIIHRDLKPSNILVTADGTPKLLDFGIAKLLGSTGASETQTQQKALTPAYASPEQLRGETVDTTSDVYSLGKILNELLSMRNSKRRARNEENKPVSENSNVVLVAPKKNPHSKFRTPYSKDLQNILTTALREDNARRYGSVEKFSEDVRRYLVGLPVSARKDTFSYRSAKFIQRKRYSAAIGLLFVLTLCGGLIATLWQAREARREREIAERRFANLRKVSGSFVTEIHRAIQDLPGSLPARQMLLTHAVEQLDALAAESNGNPALQDELAQAYYNSAELPDMRLAEKDVVFRKEIAVYEDLIRADANNIHYREQTALAKLELGDVTKVRGSVAEGIALESEAVALLEQIVREEPNDAAHLTNLATGYINIASLYLLKGDAEESRRATQNEFAAIEDLQKLAPSEPKIIWLANIGQLQTGGEDLAAGNYDSAAAALRQGLANFAAMQTNTPNDTRLRYYLWSGNRRLAEVLEKKGDSVAAAEHYQTALSIIENLLAESPQDFGYYRNSALTNIFYARLLVRRRQSAEAEKYFRRALKLSEKVLENDADNAESKNDSARAAGELGNALILTGKKEEGIDYLRKSAEMFQQTGAIDTENAELQRDWAQTRQWLNSVSRTNLF